MTPSEYQSIQQALTDLMENDRKLRYSFNSKERQAYKTAVLACKSVLSSYNPEKKGGKDN